MSSARAADVGCSMSNEGPASTALTASTAGLDVAFWLVGAIAALILVRVFILTAALPGSPRANIGILSSDTTAYHHLGDEPGLPYRDHAVAFPPVSWAFIELTNGGSAAQTMSNVGWGSLILDLLAAGAIAYGWGRRATLVYLVLGLPFLYLPFVYFRVDLLSVAMAIWGLALAKRDREVAGGAVLALAVFTKLWPLALIPALLVARRHRAFRSCVVTGAVCAFLWFMWSGVGGFLQVITFKGARGWHNESFVGGVVQAIEHNPVRIQAGAARAGTAPPWATTGLGLALVVTCACIWLAAARTSRSDGIVYGVAPLGAVATFLVFSPLLSPQYLVWLLPFAAIAWVGGHRRIASCVGVSVVLTMMLIFHYGGLVRSELGATVLLNVRNGALLGLVVSAFVVLHEAGVRAGRTRLAAARGRSSTSRSSESVGSPDDARLLPSGETQA